MKGGKELEPDGVASFLVEDDDQEGQPAVVVVLGTDGLPRAQESTTVGGADQ